MGKKAKLHTSDILDEFFGLKTGEAIVAYKKVACKMNIAAKIDDAMKLKGYDVNKFSDLMGVTPQIIKDWLSGTHNFTVDELVEIGECLKIKLI